MMRYSLENQYVNIPAFRKTKKTAPTAMQVKYDPNNVVNRNFGYYNENDIVVVINQSFLNGTLTSTLNTDFRSDNQAAYLVQCLHALEWSFNQFLIKEDVMAKFLSGAVVEMEQQIKETLTILNGSTDKDNLREKLSLESTPFKFTKRRQINIHDLPKDDERRLAFQALFLFVLRPNLPIKYETMHSFLNAYPELKQRGAPEQEKLRLTANWMDLAFHVLPSKNNKTFILNLIPRIVEGRGVKYITGSGQTKSTTERVTLFRGEGQCEKVVRPPRGSKKREENSTSSGSLDGSVSHHQHLPEDTPHGSFLDGTRADLSSLAATGSTFQSMPGTLQYEQHQEHQRHRDHLHMRMSQQSMPTSSSGEHLLGGGQRTTDTPIFQFDAASSSPSTSNHDEIGTKRMRPSGDHAFDLPFPFSRGRSDEGSFVSSSRSGDLDGQQEFLGESTSVNNSRALSSTASSDKMSVVVEDCLTTSSEVTGRGKRSRSSLGTAHEEQEQMSSFIAPAKRDGLALLSVIAGLEFDQ